MHDILTERKRKELMASIIKLDYVCIGFENALKEAERDRLSLLSELRLLERGIDEDAH